MIVDRQALVFALRPAVTATTGFGPGVWGGNRHGEKAYTIGEKSHRRRELNANTKSLEDAYRFTGAPAQSVYIPEVDQGHAMITSRGLRNTVPHPDRHTVAGPARTVRAVGDGVRTVPPLAARRYLAPHSRTAQSPGRCEGSDHLGRLGGLHHRSCPPARGRCPQRGTASPAGHLSTLGFVDDARPSACPRLRTARPALRNSDHLARNHSPRRLTAAPVNSAVLAKMRELVQTAVPGS